jgi:hypothetical protein
MTHKAFEKHISEWPLATKLAYRFMNDPDVLEHVNAESVHLIRDDRIMDGGDDTAYYNKRALAMTQLLEDMKKALISNY